MFADAIRPDRASLLAPLYHDTETRQRCLANTDLWLDEWRVRGAEQDGLAVYYDVYRRSRMPHAWETIHRAWRSVIEDAASSDEQWTHSCFEDAERRVSTILGVIDAMRMVGDATERSPGHVTAKILCDAYLDLFEACLPALASIYLPLRTTRSPARIEPESTQQRTARELFDQLTKGRLADALCAFDPFYRNGIAHRSRLQFGVDGSVTMSNEDGQESRHLSWPHLVALVQDAIQTVNAACAAIELCPYFQPGPNPLGSVEVQERVGFHLVPLGQSLAAWSPDPSGMLSLTVRGPRCQELPLLGAILDGARFATDQPVSLFIRYQNSGGTELGFWSLDTEAFLLAQSSIEGREEAVRRTQSNQLRLEGTVQRIREGRV